MRLLDLFAGAGGAAAGYAEAGFDEIVGVDLRPQKRYPFEFIQADVRDLMGWADLSSFDAIHASPPCQRYTMGAKKWGTSGNHPDLIEPVRNWLVASGRPYVIENVPGAPLRDPVMLCGAMFGLGVLRHRMFETNWSLGQLDHVAHDGAVGDGRYFTVTGHTGGSSKRDGWIGGSIQDWRKAMGIDWMVATELVEAIPPAYTRWVGRYLRAECLRGCVKR